MGTVLKASPKLTNEGFSTDCPLVTAITANISFAKICQSIAVARASISAKSTHASSIQSLLKTLILTKSLMATQMAEIARPLHMTA